MAGELSQASEKINPKMQSVPLVQDYDGIAQYIHTFEERFKHLRSSTVSELESMLAPAELLQGLVSLPIKIRGEYQMQIAKLLPTLKRSQSTYEIFIDLEDMFSFIDYGLLKHIIDQFCSHDLKIKMDVYCGDLHQFMSATTVNQLRNCWPGKQLAPLEFDLFKSKIGKDPYEYSLQELDVLRQQFYSGAKLSDLISMIIGKTTEPIVPSDDQSEQDSTGKLIDN